MTDTITLDGDVALEPDVLPVEPEVAPAPTERMGGKAIVESLVACGIEKVFGYSGGGTLALTHEMNLAGVDNMNGRTELTTAWMSYGYNRVKGWAASACVFHCVGTLHASPVVYAAKVDSTPLFVMTVNIHSSLDFREGLQDGSYVHAAMTPLSKFSRRVVVPDDIPLAIRQSIISASTGKPGPSSIDMAFQVLSGKTTCPAEPLELPEPPAASATAIARVLDLVKAAKRPVLFVGAGVHLAGATAELLAFAEALQIPVVSTSWGGRGVMSDEHPLFAGVCGSFGWTSANEIAQKSDLWIAIGTTFSQMTTGAWNMVKPDKVVQIDIDPNQLGKIFQPTIGVTGHAKVVLRQLIDAAASDSIADLADQTQLDAIAASKREWHDYHHELAGDSGTPINQYYLIDQMAKTFPKGTILVGDSGGQAFMLYRSFNYTDMTPMPLGSRYMSLGAGLPVAMGAKMAAPERTVVSYHGDGGFYYDYMELATLKERGIKVIIVIDNNHCLYANRQGWKLMGEVQNSWVDCPETTDFVEVAKAHGIGGERVTNPEDIAAALQRAMESEESYLVDVWTDPETRLKRAIKGVIPILSDRHPQQGADRHIAPPLQGSWPA